ERFETHPGGYCVRVDEGELDLQRFESLTAEGRQALDANDAALAVRLLQEAEKLWRGPPVADLGSSDRTQPEIARLEELHLVETESRIAAMLADGSHADLVPELEQLIAAHPFRERLQAQLML